MVDTSVRCRTLVNGLFGQTVTGHGDTLIACRNQRLPSAVTAASGGSVSNLLARRAGAEKGVGYRSLLASGTLDGGGRPRQGSGP